MLEGEHHGPGRQGELRDLQSLEVPVRPQPLDQLRRRRDVDGQEHAGLGRRRSTLRTMASAMCFWTPAHRRARLATGARRRPAGAGGDGQVGGQVLAGDDPAGPVAGDVGQVDPCLARHEAHRRRGERRDRCRSGRRSARRRGRRRSCGAPPPAAAPRLGAAPTARSRRAPTPSPAGRPSSVCGRRRRPRVDGDERRADRDRVARLRPAARPRCRRRGWAARRSPSPSRPRPGPG